MWCILFPWLDWWKFSSLPSWALATLLPNTKDKLCQPIYRISSNIMDTQKVRDSYSILHVYSFVFLIVSILSKHSYHVCVSVCLSVYFPSHDRYGSHMPVCVCVSVFVCVLCSCVDCAKLVNSPHMTDIVNTCYILCCG